MWLACGGACEFANFKFYDEKIQLKKKIVMMLSIHKGTYLVQTTTFVKTRANHGKKVV